MQKSNVELSQKVDSLAADELECCGLTVRRYCKELGLPTRNRLATQKRVLDTLRDLIGEPYIWEWSHPAIVNPATGWRLFYDGYFQGQGLLVEFRKRRPERWNSRFVIAGFNGGIGLRPIAFNAGIDRRRPGGFVAEGRYESALSLHRGHAGSRAPR